MASRPTPLYQAQQPETAQPYFYPQFSPCSGQQKSQGQQVAPTTPSQPTPTPTSRPTAVPTARPTPTSQPSPTTRPTHTPTSWPTLPTPHAPTAPSAPPPPPPPLEPKRAAVPSTEAAQASHTPHVAPSPAVAPAPPPPAQPETPSPIAAALQEATHAAQQAASAAAQQVASTLAPPQLPVVPERPVVQSSGPPPHVLWNRKRMSRMQTTRTPQDATMNDAPRMEAVIEDNSRAIAPQQSAAYVPSEQQPPEQQHLDTFDSPSVFDMGKPLTNPGRNAPLDKRREYLEQQLDSLVGTDVLQHLRVLAGSKNRLSGGMIRLAAPQMSSST